MFVHNFHNLFCLLFFTLFHILTHCDVIWHVSVDRDILIQNIYGNSENSDNDNKKVKNVFVIKIEDSSSTSNVIQLHYAIQHVQPLLSIEITSYSDSIFPVHSQLKSVRPNFCILSINRTAAICIDYLNLESIRTLCHQYRVNNNLANTTHLTDYCLPIDSSSISVDIEWAWLTQLDLFGNGVNRIFVIAESYSFGKLSSMKNEYFYIILPNWLYNSPHNKANITVDTVNSMPACYKCQPHSYKLAHHNEVFIAERELYLFITNTGVIKKLSISSDASTLVSCHSQSKQFYDILVVDNAIIATSSIGLIWIEVKTKTDIQIESYVLNSKICLNKLFLHTETSRPLIIYSLGRGANRNNLYQVMFPESENSTNITEFETNATIHNNINSSSDSIELMSISESWTDDCVLILIKNNNSTNYYIFKIDLESRVANFTNRINFKVSIENRDVNSWHYIPNNNTKIGNSYYDVTINISDMVAVNDKEMYLIGSALIYSPDFGNSFYLYKQINSPVILFKTSYNGAFVAITQSLMVWHGRNGYPEVQIVANISDNLIADNVALNNYTINTISIVADFSTGDAIIINIYYNNGSIVKHYHLPIPASNKEQKYNESPGNTTSLLCINDIALTNTTTLYPNNNTNNTILFNQVEWIALLNTDNSSNIPNDTSCPYSFVSLESHHCQTLSRKKISLQERFSHLLLTQHEHSILYPILNCSYKGEGLPRFIYLDKSNSFDFTVTFHLSSNCLTDLHRLPRISIWTSSDILSISQITRYSNLTNRLEYQFSLLAIPTVYKKLITGSVFARTELQLKTWPVTPSCWSHSLINTKTDIYTGCPGELEIYYDKAASEISELWSRLSLCDEYPNITCVFFDFSFSPIFYINDKLTGQMTPYKGYYTLRPIAAGFSLDKMTHFENVTNSLGLWSLPDFSSNHIRFSTENNKSSLKWVCLQDSFCVDPFPTTSSGVTAYFLTIEFSNSLEEANNTMCHFETEFTVIVFGLPLGPVGISLTFVVSLLAYCLLIVLLYLAYFYRNEIENAYNKYIYDNIYYLLEIIFNSIVAYKLKSNSKMNKPPSKLNSRSMHDHI